MCWPHCSNNYMYMSVIFSCVLLSEPVDMFSESERLSTQAEEEVKGRNTSGEQLEKEKAGEGGGGGGGGLLGEVSWEYKWDNEEGAELHGPFNSTQMSEWADSGYVT